MVLELPSNCRGATSWPRQDLMGTQGPRGVFTVLQLHSGPPGDSPLLASGAKCQGPAEGTSATVPWRKLKGIQTDSHNHNPSQGPFLVACLTNGKLTEEGNRDFTGTSMRETGARQAAPNFLHGHGQQQWGTFSRVPRACYHLASLSLKKLFSRKATDGFAWTSDGHMGCCGSPLPGTNPSAEFFTTVQWFCVTGAHLGVKRSHPTLTTQYKLSHLTKTLYLQ